MASIAAFLFHLQMRKENDRNHKPEMETLQANKCYTFNQITVGLDLCF